MADTQGYYMMPAGVTAKGDPAIWDYALMRIIASRLTGYVKVKLDVLAALALADKSPFPRGVRLGVMKQVAGNKEITLSQMQILLGYAARKAQR